MVAMHATNHPHLRLGTSEIKRKVVGILRRNSVVRAGLFGSFARGEARRTSDVDVLIEYRRGKTLFDLIELENELSRILGCAVDLVTYRSLHPLLRERILREEVKLL